MEHGNNQKAGDGQRKFNALVRCSTMLCGRQAIAYSGKGLLPKCDICMSRNHHFVADDRAIPKWYPKITSNDNHEAEEPKEKR